MAEMSLKNLSYLRSKNGNNSAYRKGGGSGSEDGSSGASARRKCKIEVKKKMNKDCSRIR